MLRKMEGEAQIWHARFLGATRVEGPRGPVERLRTRSAFALLAFVVLNRSRVHSREELADRFWPEDDPEAARGKLRLALHSIRSALGDLFDTDRYAVRVACPERVESDRDDLLRLVASPPDVRRPERLARAVDLYQGPFLPGFYDEWSLGERDRLETAVGGALRELAQGYAEGDRWAESHEAAARLVALQPYDEAGHVLLLRSLERLGRPEALSRTLEWTRERFAEIGGRPGAAVEAFARAGAAAPETDEPEPSFLGREADLRRTLDAIAHHPVVALWGPPGVGKTRLAREALGILHETATFVSAVGLESAEALANALRPTLGGGAFESLPDRAEAVAPRLLVIDNLESLPEEAIALLGELRRRNPGLRFLFTSQTRSGLAEEAVVPVAPFEVPPEGASAAQVAASVPLRLLRDRVRERGRRLKVDASNAAAFGALCRRLEGLPLALELAAEWLDVLGPADIVARLDESGRRLDARLPGREPRHRSLETAIAASLGRLEPPLRSALQSLAVFPGGWSLAAAESVLEGEIDAAHALGELEARSLVKADAAHSRVRYSMLESIRILVRDATPEAARAAALRRHAAHFARVGQAMEAAETSLVEEYRADDENVRLAAETLLDTEPDAERAAIAIGGFQGYWQKLGRWELAARTLERAIARMPDAPSLTKARLYHWLDYIGFATDDPPLCDRCTEAAYRILLELGDTDRAARCRAFIGGNLVRRGDYANALPHLEAYREIAHRKNFGFHGGERVYADLILGEALSCLGRDEEALRLMNASLAWATEAEAHQRMGAACGAIGWHLHLRERATEGLPFLERAVDLLADSEETFRVPNAQARLAHCRVALGDVGAARGALGEAVRLAVAQGRTEDYADAAEAAAATAALARAFDLAARLLGGARAFRRRTICVPPRQATRLDTLEADLIEALGAGRFAAERLRGETSSRAEIARDALAVAGAE